ncbi:MAG: gamma-glutamyltransferase family protein [Fretibacterium sp.]|nr:gamma-glutamyltransferase family protein [Fretibacterium sp.]
MDFDALRYRYPSRRSVVFGTRGMVATGQPLAAQAGLDILKRGGNAVDAAVATAACLTVVEPTSNGIGGDCFALVWMENEKKLHGLNSSGPAPRLADAEAIRAAGHSEMPQLGWVPVTVPGAPAGWAKLVGKFGKLTLAEDLAPAIDYAREGTAVSPTVSLLWHQAFEKYSRCHGVDCREWFRTFCPEGRAPMPGEIWRSSDHAETLTRIAESEAEDFYCGELADRIDAFAQATGGLLRKADLSAFSPQSGLPAGPNWVEPVSVSYRGIDVWEIPPNGHGIAALMALKILEGLGVSGGQSNPLSLNPRIPTERETEETYHLQIEAMKLAFADVRAYVADPRFMTCRTEDLLSDIYADKRRALIGPTALEPAPGRPGRGGTVYLASADGEGNMVSMIQSNYMGFGSGLVVPGTGIALHNRGANFSLDPASPNVLAPGKKPYHTIIPGFLTKGGRAVGPFGVMGAFMQPQGHVQVVANLVDFNMNPQEALDAPRWQWTGGKKILLERAVSPRIAEGLRARGHEVEVLEDSTSFGRGEIILRVPHSGLPAGPHSGLPSGPCNGFPSVASLAGATEPRTDGCVAVW